MRGDAREANEYAYVRRGATRRDFGNRETDGLGVSGRVSGPAVSPGAFRAAGISPVPHARPAPAPRMRPITGDAEIVEFYELSDRAFEKPGR
jgi:hypothetical protein